MATVTFMAAEPRSAATHAAVEVSAVPMSVAFRPLMQMRMDPGMARIIDVMVIHDVLPSYPNALVRSRYIGNISQPVVYSHRLDGGVELRTATAADVEVCLAAQRRSAVVGYAHIFPQHEYPFPDDVVRQEWIDRFAAGVPVTVALVAGVVVGTVSVRTPRLESLFVVPEHWGTGVARALHDAAVAQIAAAGLGYAELDVMTENLRARRFYEKLGWAPDGRTDISPYPPFPTLTGYRLDLT
jgi:GNAT superfamily N-acetyltransferase